MSNQPVEYEQVGYNASDGIQMGRSSTELLGFYGTAPTAKPTMTGSVSSGACLSTVVAALAALGLVTNSTAA
jgi:hypothetical protein